ncbi:MAG: hypothetical protein DHS20C14_00080 [Phycisphaeraceae bacterium]|nr:MAG: hypothetical protein DHS20C14_00080 [Phycisphaeraceae bacterium]
MRNSTQNLVIVACCLAVTGCLPKQHAAFDAPAPNKRLDAIVGAAGGTDQVSLDGLVGQLESTDPAARVLAIQALERRTGETLGYAHSDPAWKRRAAVDRWKKYAAGKEQAAATPGSVSP